MDPTRTGGNLEIHRKMYFYSRDVIRIKNPLEEDFRFKYDSIWNAVKAGETKDVERYLAEAFLDAISQKIIGDMIAAQAQAAIDEFSKTNKNLLVDKYIENREIWMKLPRTDNRDLLAKIAKDCVVGLVEKFGEEREIPQEEKAKLNPNTPLYQELMNELTKQRVTDSLPQAPIINEQPAQTVSNEALVNEVSI